jgi:hypothetical protein
MIEVRRVDDNELCGYVDHRRHEWQAITILGRIAQPDRQRRVALEQDVVAEWQPFITNGKLVLRLDLTVASACNTES